ncbi:Hydroxymethylpyrimidine pyrophosphatase [Bradyrhizobium lablabi]|uniref:Hydroxymethylpyrimidine pyrophosphatase n=1 Tax=Bradyrhizobium lablabi TaxID=722472 RepID=A0A1M6JBU7_9BRAD|nr:HAD hydrolase family protein [Bradyrhizobium lablabi]SHJ44107.1 Hydroxymethylpyrimidine pyrophosphatase [Bradyrhizobium lablabi]
MMLTLTKPAMFDRLPARHDALPAETNFYSAYNWCLDPHLTVGEAIERLADEIDRLPSTPGGWQTSEVVTNVFLLSCGLLNAVDEHLRGPTLRMPRALAARALGRSARWATERLTGILPQRRRAQVRRWRERWQAGLDDFLAVVVARQLSDPTCFAESGSNLAKLLLSPLPPDLQTEHIGVPTPFRRLDLTHFDVLALGQRFAQRFPDRSEAILILGLRTSGSYFAPLLRAFFKAEGYRTVSSLTIQPNKGPGRWERQELSRCAQRGFTALIVDDAPHTGDTIVLGLDLARRAGFAPDKLRVLAPAHPARRDCFGPLSENFVVSLEPEQWHKHRLLDQRLVEGRLAEYFWRQNVADIRLVASKSVTEFNARLQSLSRGGRSTRLKRIYEVHLKTPQGQEGTRYVLAKSVGWGWLGYHAFLAGHRLSGFVPPILGLRDGILYMEWFPQASFPLNRAEEREKLIETSASYVAARVRCLSLGTNLVSSKHLRQHQNGYRLLQEALSKAYGRIITDTLMRPRLERRLAQQHCPLPTLIDGNMARTEWINGSHGLLKTDYEHHGMGKSELNVVDPAYDLAETILTLALSPDEESRLIRRYVEQSEDTGVERRLFMNKLLAGFWAMDTAQAHLFGKPLAADRQQEFHLQFMSAWNFLTVHAARYCGSFCRPPQALEWRSPLVALDVDGVLDRRLFGFPCASAVGIEALSLLNAHGFSVALNTARSAAEVKDYCQAYHLAGGVAEHGSYLWDAVGQRERILIDPEAMVQLDQLRSHLRLLPGVFLDDRHQYSIRAFSYHDKPRGLLSSVLNSARSFSIGGGAPAPLPKLIMHHLMKSLGLDRLSFHQTTIDTTIVAKDVNKGTGLSALRDWVLRPDAETIAVGDSEWDLPMFRAATHSFAPANIDRVREARLLGCQIVRHPYQRGLLEIARLLVHPHGGSCEHCAEGKTLRPGGPTLFLEVLQAADESRARNLFRGLFDPAVFRIFVR